MPNKVRVTIIRSNGAIVTQEGHNLRTNAGVNWQADLMGNSSSALTAIRNIALSQSTATPVSTMTNLAGELISDGLSRKTATYSHTANASTYTLSATWNCTSSSTITVSMGAVVFAATDLNTSADTHFLITAFSPVAVLTSGDTLSVDWGISI